MASVSLPPRSIYEWCQAYYLLPKTDPQKIRDLCSEMEKELGQVSVERDIGELGALLAKFATITHQNEEDEGTSDINDGEHQAYAELYREFEKRLSKLENLERELNLYLGKNENINKDILNKRNLLTIKMDAMRGTRTELLNQFNSLNFTPYNRIFQSAANVFVFAPIQTLSSLLKTKKIETLALSSFVLAAGYSLLTNTHTSFLVKATAPLFFMYIGHIFSKILRSDEQIAGPQTFSITVTPPSSPKKPSSKMIR